jgi:hypothetical protein
MNRISNSGFNTSTDRGTIRPLRNIHKRNNRRRQQNCQHDAAQIVQAGIAPDAAVQPEFPEYRNLQRDNPQQRLLHFRVKIGRQIKIEAQQIGQYPREDNRNNVVNHCHCGANIRFTQHHGLPD